MGEEMTRARIKKSFKLDSEPVVHWAKGPAKRVRLDGFKLAYPGEGMAYTLYPEKAASVEMVEWEIKKGGPAWNELFSEPQLQPNGLRALAQLHANFTAKTVCEWVSRNGLLGFHQVPDPAKRPFHFIPYYVDNRRIYYFSEPRDCIRLAAQHAANVLGLWEALKKSYATGQVRGSDEPIRSIVTIKEDVTDSSQVGSSAIRYRVFVNGERRSQWPIPKRPRGWRYLANALLAEYIQKHIYGEVQVALGIREQNKDEVQQDRNKDEEQQDRKEEPPPDWNLQPTWHIQSALAAYYVELLMVMRRFRSCKTCGKDISHQKAKSVYCGDTSTCRSTDWHRQKAAQRKASKTPSR